MGVPLFVCLIYYYGFLGALLFLKSLLLSSLFESEDKYIIIFLDILKQYLFFLPILQISFRLDDIE